MEKAIAELIVECIDSNSKLPTETELMKKFGVSRFALREVLGIFEANGIIVSTQGKGRYAQVPDLGVQVKNTLSIFLQAKPTMLLELCEIRTILEINSIPLAMKSIKVEQLQALSEQVAIMREKAAREERFVENDRNFHCILFSSTGNTMLSQLLTAFWDLYESANICPEDDDLVTLAEQHHDILQAFVYRDIEKATELLQLQFDDATHKIEMAIIGI